MAQGETEGLPEGSARVLPRVDVRPSTGQGKRAHGTRPGARCPPHSHTLSRRGHPPRRHLVRHSVGAPGGRRRSEPTKDSFFRKGAVRYVDASDDHLSLEFVSDSPVALSNAVAALTDRWGDRAEVHVEFPGTPDSVLGSAAEARQDLRRRLSSIQSVPPGHRNAS